MHYWLLRKVHPHFALVCFTVGIILGVAIFSLSEFWVFSSPVWLIVAVTLLFICFWRPYFLILSLAVLAGFMVSGYRTSAAIVDREYISQFVGQTITVSGTLFEDPDVDGSHLKLRLDNLVFGDSYPAAGTLFVTIKKPPTQLSRSDRVKVEGKLSAGFGSFSGTMFRPEIQEIAHPDPPDLALQFRDAFGDGVRKFIPEPEVDLSLGYLLGQKRALPPDLSETLQIVGLTHIVVASGYNLSILVRFTRRAFKKVSRFAALFAGIILIISFISIVGFTPSMTRAGLVSILALLVWYFGRQFHPAKLLALVAAITLLISPAYITDLAWLLSFASFAGVMLLAPLLTVYFYGTKKDESKSGKKELTKPPSTIAQVALETISAQLCCLPLLFYFFGSFSLVSVIANLLVLPTIPAVMALTFATGIFAFLVPIATIIGTITTWALQYHLLVINFFGSLTEFVVAVPKESIWAFALYLPILALAIYLRIKTKLRLRTVNVVE